MKYVLLALALGACSAPAGAQLVRIDGGPARWASHPITQLDIRECEKLAVKFGAEACRIERLSTPARD